MNIHELRDELSNQKLKIQALLFKSKIDVDAKLVQTSMLFEDLGAFENYLVSRDEQYDRECVIITEADLSIETETKLMSLKEVYMVKDLIFFK